MPDISRTVIDIDRELLAQAREILGTRTIRDTVNRSLAVVVRKAAFEREFEELAGDFGERLAEDVRTGDAWR